MLADVDRNKVEKTQSDDAAASTLIKIMEESEYNQVTGEQVELEPGQALVFQAKQKNYGYDTIELGNQTYEVKNGIPIRNRTFWMRRRKCMRQ